MSVTESIDLAYRNIRFLRLANQLSQKEMAKILNISVGTRRKMERGIPTPRVTIDILWQLRDAFGFSPSTLLSFDLQQLVRPKVPTGEEL